MVALSPKPQRGFRTKPRVAEPARRTPGNQNITPNPERVAHPVLESVEPLQGSHCYGLVTWGGAAAPLTPGYVV